METKIYRVSSKRPSIKKLQECAEILKSGGLVAFPTETVYGLGASAFLDEAVKKIFIVKGRPGDNPIIVHISNLSQLSLVAREVPEKARLLAEKFWPGPITLILPKAKAIPNSVTANLDTVAVRMPSHPVARKLIEIAGPIAAPSANLSGKVSPTRAEHVIADLYGKIEAIIDGGNTHIGLESTVVGNLKDVPVLLRPGGVTLEMLEAVVGHVEVHAVARGETEASFAISPGMKYRHYSPDAKVILVETSASARIFEIFEKERRQCKAALLLFSRQRKGADIFVGSKGSMEEYAKNLFRLLRELDKRGYESIVVEGVEEKGIGLAIMNRLRKSASEIIR